MYRRFLVGCFALLAMGASSSHAAIQTFSDVNSFTTALTLSGGVWDEIPPPTLTNGEPLIEALGPGTPNGFGASVQTSSASTLSVVDGMISSRDVFEGLAINTFLGGPNAIGFYSEAGSQGNTVNIGQNQYSVANGAFFGYIGMSSLASVAINPIDSGAVSKLFVVDDLPFFLGQTGSTPPGAVPEPSTLAVMALGAIGIVAGGVRRRRKVSNS